MKGDKGSKGHVPAGKEDIQLSSFTHDVTVCGETRGINKRPLERVSADNKVAGAKGGAQNPLLSCTPAVPCGILTLKATPFTAAPQKWKRSVYLTEHVRGV